MSYNVVSIISIICRSLHRHLYRRASTNGSLQNFWKLLLMLLEAISVLFVERQFLYFKIKMYIYVHVKNAMVPKKIKYRLAPFIQRTRVITDRNRRSPIF